MVWLARVKVALLGFAVLGCCGHDQAGKGHYERRYMVARGP